MINSIIIEDETKSRTILQVLIERYTKGISITGVADSKESGIKLIEEVKPELVFLDISMPDGNGFEVLESVQHKDFEVIFTTAHNEYAIQAIKSEALDYILKPINIIELQQATSKAINKIHKKENFNHLRKQLTDTSALSQCSKLAIPTLTGHSFVDKNEIIYLAAKGAYTEVICLNGKKHTSSYSLKEYETTLSEKMFFRVHHSYIINLTHIKSYHRGDGNYITLSDNTEIPLARRKKKEFLALFSI